MQTSIWNATPRRWNILWRTVRSTSSLISYSIMRVFTTCSSVHVTAGVSSCIGRTGNSTSAMILPMRMSRMSRAIIQWPSMTTRRIKPYRLAVLMYLRRLTTTMYWIVRWRKTVPLSFLVPSRIRLIWILVLIIIGWVRQDSYLRTISRLWISCSTLQSATCSRGHRLRP